MLVVADDLELRGRISAALWEQQPESFLANGEAGEVHAGRQPILLSGECGAANDAEFVLLADGVWREESNRFERVLLVFGDDRLEETRAVWRSLDGIEGTERHFWKQEGGKWREGP